MPKDHTLDAEADQSQIEMAETTYSLGKDAQGLEISADVIGCDL